jgi:hypothetical protein
MNEFKGIKTIPGNENYSTCLQKPVMHAIFREFIMNMKSDPNGKAESTLILSAVEMRKSMQSPFGKIEMTRQNLYKDDTKTSYYALRDLERLPNIIESEDYISRTIILDDSFKLDWAAAKRSIKTLLREVKVFALNAEMPITAGTFNRYLKVRGHKHFLEQAKLCMMRLRQAWQRVYYSYVDIFETIKHNG